MCNVKNAKKESLASANNKQVLKKSYTITNVQGESVVRRDHQNDDCSSDPQLVFRASSSIYFANTLSSILIPPYSKAINIYLNRNRRLWTQIEELLLIMQILLKKNLK